jgi:hypothetical protein
MLTPLPGSHDHREMKRRGDWMDPDFNKRDSFHATIKHPLMNAEEWTEAYEDAWKTFYSKENMIKALSKWTDTPKNYWNLMAIFFWYKNAALIEKQHPMVAGFFRLKDRKVRRPGYAVDSLPVHLWKRTKENTALLITWAKFVKEMEEVWLQTRNKSETEERWLEQIQRTQSDIWRALRIGEIQNIYNNVKDTLPERVTVLLAPLDDLSSRILYSRRDLNRFLKQWEQLRQSIQDLRLGESETARKWLDEMQQIQTSIRFSDRINEWQESYQRLRNSLPSRAQLSLIHYDAINDRVVHSRQQLQRIWSESVNNFKAHKLWALRPLQLTRAAIHDLFLTRSFAATFKEFSKLGT